MASPKMCNPDLDNPAETKYQVRQIYKRKPANIEMASRELAPIFGLGSGFLAQQRAQTLFTHPAFRESFAEFQCNYLKGQWDLPVGSFVRVHELAHKVRRNPIWVDEQLPDCTEWDVTHFYTRFALRTWHGIKESKLALAGWLKDVEICPAIHVLVFALVYLQLETMRDCKKEAPIRDRIHHFVESWKADK
ncbi:uncharacterized protein GGS22DRAFT_196422 [Annulohypoxylon maeteangense]|uniref:uncharacterized protein n=1 Tax=Annulohypoxylon maeteangense TaxID=1927788 RepID=UPI0020088AA7|nr:uncharacterized protein GGS22DRAFT_196422 [Annulohypoxylon maeteangense]KAI0881474.1 hypothetical protein GGS22DRAFT_196422 [Annulohypoxylon maeteangense]